MTEPISNCCKAPVRIEGDVTMYYVCTKCDKPCDRYSIEYKEVSENEDGR